MELTGFTFLAGMKDQRAHRQFFTGTTPSPPTISSLLVPEQQLPKT